MARAWLASIALAAARAVALFLGGFTLLNLAGGLCCAGFDANLWWIDLRPLPAAFADALLAALGVALVAFGLRPALGPRRRWITMTLLAVGAAGTLRNAATFYHLACTRRIALGLPVPLSLLLAIVLLALLAASWRQPAPAAQPATTAGAARRLPHLILVVFFLALCGLGFPLAQMYFFGKTDYRRPAGAIVVLGCRAYADGTPSDALADRVRTACQLYHAGQAGLLIFSGGPGDGPVHETESMRRLAVRLGVPPEAIVCDEGGLNTDATVRNTGPILDERGIRRVLVVSHFYHLPRIKLTYQRQGREVFTVPARESYPLTQMPYLVAREVAALWAYYLRPLRA